MPRKRTSEGELLDVALQVFADKGYHGATVQDIHARAGVGRGTFYLYFGSKEEVFNRLLERTLAPLRLLLDMPPAQVALLVPRNLRSRGFDLLAMVIEYALENRAATTLFLRESLVAGPEFAAQVEAFFHDATAWVAAVAAELVRTGWLNPTVDPTTMALTLLGAIKELLMHELACPTGRAPRAWVGDLARTLLEGGAGPRLREAWGED